MARKRKAKEEWSLTAVSEGKIVVENGIAPYDNDNKSQLRFLRLEALVE